MKIVLCTVSDDRQGRKGGLYGKTQAGITKLVEPFGIEHHAWTYSDVMKTDLGKAYYMMLRHVDPAKNGRLYKPLVILKELDALKEGDYLIYNDCSPEMWQGVEHVLVSDHTRFGFHYVMNLLDRNENMLSHFVQWDWKRLYENDNGIHLHAHFTLDRCMEKMGLTTYRHSYQHASGLMVFRKTEDTFAFVAEWFQWNSEEDCSCLGKIHLEKDYSFWDDESHKKIGCRHDQSVSGLLMNKYNKDLIFSHNHESVIPSYNIFRLMDIHQSPHWQFKYSNTSTDHGYCDRILPGDKVKNSAGRLMHVYEIYHQSDGMKFVVGEHRQSAYLATEEELTRVP